MSPAFLALGLVGLLGSPRPWPWPWAVSEASAPGASLESWLGLPLWIEWIVDDPPLGRCPGGARHGGGGRAARTIVGRRRTPDGRRTGSGPGEPSCWPLVRPRSARAAAVVFVFALAEPGAPLVLGLRRTLAFQIVEAAGRPDPFPAAAVWAVMTGLFGLAGWLVWRWGAGPSILDNRENGAVNPRDRPWPRDASRVRRLALTALVAGLGDHRLAAPLGLGPSRACRQSHGAADDGRGAPTDWRARPPDGPAPDRASPGQFRPSGSGDRSA